MSNAVVRLNARSAESRLPERVLSSLEPAADEESPPNEESPYALTELESSPAARAHSERREESPIVSAGLLLKQ